jgi:multidrug resistance efflux pump
VGGRSPNQALRRARTDLEELERSLQEAREKISEMRMDVRYGLAET